MTMRAMRFHEYGGPEVLRLEEAPRPEPGAGEVRVAVAASAFNPADAGIRGGWLRDAFPVALPHIPGYDVAGTVDAVGEGVEEPRVGDAVVGFLSMVEDGGAAQSVIAPADGVVPAPRSVPLVDAAALPSVATTAWQALFEDADLQPGQRLLVNGAGGTVGGYAVQLGRHAGAHVIAVTGAGDLPRVAALGADEVLDRAAADLGALAPVDVVLNLGPIDGAALAGLTALVADGGVVVNTVPALPTPGDEARGVRGVGLFVRSAPATLRRLVALVDEGELRVEVAERLPLAELPGVHARSDAGTLRGKVVLVPPTS